MCRSFLRVLFFCNGSAFSSLFPHYATLILTYQMRPRSNPVFSFCVIMHLHSDSCTDAHKKVWDGLKLLDTVYFLWKRLSSLTQILFFSLFSHYAHRLWICICYTLYTQVSTIIATFISILSHLPRFYIMYFLAERLFQNSMLFGVPLNRILKSFSKEVIS